MCALSRGRSLVPWWHNGGVDLAKKLQLRDGQSVAVLNMPERITLDLHDGISVAEDPSRADAVILFARDRSQLDAEGRPFIAAASRDAVAWVSYPKGGQLGTDLNRDSLWELLAEHGIRPVRQVSIDSTWSALRFRPS